MRVQLDGGESVALGTTSTGATISITDYSKRTTDDFGVTTVVERGFARKLAVRLGMPADQVDATQRLLARLRATAALWVADERYAWLSARGFYRDFAVDVAAGLSLCTLTIEGLAETEPAADAGGDPAIEGSSTLQLLQPLPVTDGVLTASSVAEDELGPWSPMTSYPVGSRVIRSHRIYESLVAANLGHDPAAVTGEWLDTGPTNRWAMFDQALGTSTEAPGPIVVTLAPGAAQAVALLDVAGATVRVQAPGGYDRVQAVGEGSILFLDLPGVAGNVTVTIAGPGTVSIGTLLVGRLVGLGVTETAPSAGITDYSRKETDEFGETTVVPRSWAKKMDAASLIRTDAIDLVAGRIAAVRARPCLWIGSAELDSLVVYGFWKDFSIDVAETTSRVSLSIEGLSTAGKVKPLTVASDWADLTDRTGTKPDNGADKTSDNVSKDTAAVFGKPSAEIVDALEAARGALRQLDEVTLPTIRSSVAGADQRITDARNALDGRIDTARGEIDAERQRALSAEGVLNERISNVIADGTGYDDAAIYARVGGVDRARADGDRALSEKIDTVQSSYSRGITANGDFALGAAGWYGPGFTFTGGLARSTPGQSNDLSAIRPTKLVDPARAYRLHCAFSVEAAAQRIYVGLQVFSATGRHLGNIYADDFITSRAPGEYQVDQLYQGINPALPDPSYAIGGQFPPGAASVGPVFLANYADGGQQPVPGAFATLKSFWLEDVTDARQVDARVTREAVTLAAATKAVADRTDVTEAQLRGDRDSALAARIRDTNTALVDGLGAAARRTGLVEARLDDVPAAINARVETAERASASRDVALADRAAVLEATAGSAKGWLNANPDFSAWPDGQEHPTGWTGYGDVGPVSRTAATLGRGGWALDRTAAGPTSGLMVPGVYAEGGWYVLFAHVWRLSGGWRGSGVTWGGMDGMYIDFGTDLDDAGLGPDADSGGVKTWTKLVRLPDAYGSSYRSWHAMDSWTGFGSHPFNKSLRWLFAGVRRAFDSEVKAQKADAALNGPGGVLARMTATDAVLADLPNRYAAISRTEALEAQVNFAADSGLQRTINARIEDRSTAIADAKAGAVAETVRTLRGEYDGTKVAVTQHAAVIADKLGAGTAVFRFAAEAGSSVADVTGIAGAGAPSILRFRADTIIFDGRAIFNDSVGLGKLARSEYGSYASYYAALDNGYTPPLGQTYVIIDPAQAPLGRIGAGGSVLIEVEVNIVTNAGTRTVTSHPDGRQMITDILADGGVSVGVGNIGRGFGTNGLNRYVYNIPNPEQTPYDARISAVVSRGSVNQPYSLDGEFYYRQVSADYTVYSLRVTGKWTFI